MEQPLVDEETIHELPPSAKLVLKVLEWEGILTQKGLAEETRLPQRTVRETTGRLSDAGFVEERPYFRDARQSTYRLAFDIPTA